MIWKHDLYTVVAKIQQVGEYRYWTSNSRTTHRTPKYTHITYDTLPLLHLVPNLLIRSYSLIESVYPFRQESPCIK